MEGDQAVTLLGTFTVTAYCAAKCCTPGHELTASGTHPAQGFTIAAPRGISLGTHLRIEGVGWRIVEDRLARKYDDRFDVYFERHEDAVKFGKRKLKVWKYD